MSGDGEGGVGRADVGADPVHRADYRNMVEEPWAGTGGLSEHGFLYFILAIFITYVTLIAWLEGEPFRERGVLMVAKGVSPLRGIEPEANIVTDRFLFTVESHSAEQAECR